MVYIASDSSILHRMTGRVRGGVHVRSRPGEFVLPAAAVALVPAEPMSLFFAALTSTAAIVLAGFLRRPDRTSGRSRTESDPLEDRLAKALAASEFTRSVESHAISDAWRSHTSESAPPVRHVRTTSGRLAGGSGEDLPEAAVAAADEGLSAEIGGRAPGPWGLWGGANAVPPASLRRCDGERETGRGSRWTSARNSRLVRERDFPPQTRARPYG